MLCNKIILDISVINPDLHYGYFNYPGNNGLIELDNISGWRDYLYTLCIKSNRVPIIHKNQYHLALKIMLLAWVELGVIKASELQALLSLEGALAQVYFNTVLERDQKKQKHEIVPAEYKPGLCRYLDHMVAHDELPKRYHNEDRKKTKDPSMLHLIRNSYAHGNPFCSLPWGGLMEVIRDVIEHAYRNHPELDEQFPTLSANVPNNKTGLFGESIPSGYF